MKGYKQIITMMSRNGGGKLHKKEQNQVIERYKIDGWKVIDLQGKSPDLIAYKDNKIICIELLGQLKTKRGIKHSWTFRQKQKLYMDLGFDDVVIETFYYLPNKKELERIEDRKERDEIRLKKEYGMYYRRLKNESA